MYLLLIEPIAKERADGYTLPDASFTAADGVESWFIKEKGFQANSKKKKLSKKRKLASSKKKKKFKKKKKKRLKKKLRNKKRSKK